MSTPDFRDAIDNELRRVLIQNHPHYAAWYESLTPRLRQVIDGLLDEDVTPEIIVFSQEVLAQGQEPTFQFVSILAGGNPSPNVVLGLTNIALCDILEEVRTFENPQ